MLMMVNRYGQEYACSIPPLPQDLKSGKKDDKLAQEESVDISGKIWYFSAIYPHGVVDGL